MIFATGFVIFVIGASLCYWNKSKPYTWRDRYFPYIGVFGVGLMAGSVVIWLAGILP